MDVIYRNQNKDNVQQSIIFFWFRYITSIELFFTYLLTDWCTLFLLYCYSCWIDCLLLKFGLILFLYDRKNFGVVLWYGAVVVVCAHFVSVVLLINNIIQIQPFYEVDKRLNRPKRCVSPEDVVRGRYSTCIDWIERLYFLFY
jgi:hypothetical protein